MVSWLTSARFLHSEGMAIDAFVGEYVSSPSRCQSEATDSTEPLG